MIEEMVELLEWYKLYQKTKCFSQANEILKQIKELKENK